MKRKRNTPLRSGMIRLCAVLGVILCILFSGTLYFTVTASQMGYLTPDGEPILPQITGLSAGKEEKSIHFLLIGQDRQEGETGTRSDSMILCTFLPKSGNLVFTSVMRDLYVPIPGHGSNRINAAYAIGGTALLRQTLEENLDIRIEGCVEVDFSQFSRIIDLLGGVSLELREDEAALISRETGTSLAAGMQKLNGDQALSYARIRKLDANGDFSRTDRQRKVIGAILDSYKSAELPTLLRVLIHIFPLVSTDMSQGQLMSHAAALFPHLKSADVRSQRIPFDGQCADRTIDGMEVLIADMEQLRKNLKETWKCS